MKYIYVAFLASNYRVGKTIRMVTRYRFSHVAISEKEDISEMYSFARRYRNTPFVAGFVCEHLSRYTIGRKATPVKVCRVELDEDEYDELKRKLDCFKKEPEKYRYNYLSAINYLFRRKCRSKYAYTCIDFVLYLLNIDSFMSIAELEKLLDSSTIYEGTIEQLAGKIERNPDDSYFEYKSVKFQAKELAADVRAMVKKGKP